MLYHKKLIKKQYCFLNYFLRILIRFLIICVGFQFFDKFMNLIHIIPFFCDIFFFYKNIKKGELSNKYKEEDHF